MFNNHIGKLAKSGNISKNRLNVSRRQKLTPRRVLQQDNIVTIKEMKETVNTTQSDISFCAMTPTNHLLEGARATPQQLEEGNPQAKRQVLAVLTGNPTASKP